MLTDDQSSERFLADYVLQGEPDRILLVGHPPIDIVESRLAAGLERFDRLEDAQLSSREAQDVTPAINTSAAANADAADLNRSLLVMEVGRAETGERTVGSSATDQVLGLAVRHFPWRVLVHCCDQHIGDERFYAFGFRKLDVRSSASTSLTDESTTPQRNSPSETDAETAVYSRWYEYRLSDYKRAPDWLNARYWANPERFLLSDEEEEDIDLEDDITDEEE